MSLALTPKDVLRLTELLRQNDCLRDELRRVPLPHEFGSFLGCAIGERFTMEQSSLKTMGCVRSSSVRSERNASTVADGRLGCL